MFLDIDVKKSQISQENTCVGASFQYSCRLKGCNTGFSCEIFEILKNNFFTEHLGWMLLIVQHNDKIFLLMQLSNKILLTVVSTDYVVRHFTKQTLGLVLKKFRLALNRSFDRQTQTKNSHTER